MQIPAGWMWGRLNDKRTGQKGFGYLYIDPMAGTSFHVITDVLSPDPRALHQAGYRGSSTVRLGGYESLHPTSGDNSFQQMMFEQGGATGTVVFVLAPQEIAALGLPPAPPWASAYLPGGGGQSPMGVSQAPGPAVSPEAASLAAGARSIAKATVAVLGFRAVIWIAFRILGMVGIHFGSSAAYDGISALVGLTGLVLYFIWFARFYGWVRLTSGPTKYSTGMAIGGWFIPFLNFAYPCLGLQDAWRRGMRTTSSSIVVGWWLCYLGATLTSVYFSAMNGREISEGMVQVFDALSWLDRLFELGAYGLWAYIVNELTKKLG